jgi:hypothetical protein
MRIPLIAFAGAALVGLAFTPGAVAQNLPSEVEEQLGIPPNSMNRDGRRDRYRPLPSDVEQKMRERAYGRYSHPGYHDDDGYRRYRPARQYNYYRHYPYPF